MAEEVVHGVALLLLGEVLFDVLVDFGPVPLDLAAGHSGTHVPLLVQALLHLLPVFGHVLLFNQDLAQTHAQLDSAALFFNRVREFQPDLLQPLLIHELKVHAVVFEPRFYQALVANYGRVVQFYELVVLVPFVLQAGVFLLALLTVILKIFNLQPRLL